MGINEFVPRSVKIRANRVNDDGQKVGASVLQEVVRLGRLLQDQRLAILELEQQQAQNRTHKVSSVFSLQFPMPDDSRSPQARVPVKRMKKS